MKKILALALALMLCLCSVAFAEDAKLETKATTCNAVIKAYTVNGEELTATKLNDLYPNEKLNFTVEEDAGNPVTGDTAPVVTVNELTVTGSTNQKLTINIPTYTVAGTYHYTISETANNPATTGVTYTTDKIELSVMVTYDYDDSDNDGFLMTASVGITADGSTKNDTFTNTYEVGKLSVTKNVTGNLADKNKDFTIHVTFNATNPVLSDITYIDEDGTLHTIAYSAMSDNTETVDIDICDGETVTFYNIPAGVTYTVEEDEKHIAAGETPTAEELNSEEGYLVTYTGEKGTISSTAAAEATVNNAKATEVDTGIALDNAPYMIVLALVVVAGVMMMKKRSYNA